MRRGVHFTAQRWRRRANRSAGGSSPRCPGTHPRAWCRLCACVTCRLWQLRPTPHTTDRRRAERMLLATICAALSLRRAPLRTTLPALSASVTVQCGDAFDERLEWLLSLTHADDETSPLLRVEEIGPADSPRYARVAGAGLALWIERSDAPAQPLALRLPRATAVAQQARFYVL